MAIRVIEGVPGSGKTYYVVHHLLNNYFHWDGTADAWVPNSVVGDERPVVVYSNVSGFAMARDLDQEITRAGGLLKFFAMDRQKAMSKDTRLIYVIDEAQRLFHRKFFDQQVFLFFQWHRHLGIEVYLVTQDVKTISVELRNLAEHYVRARRRTLSVFGEFRYQFFGSEWDKEPFRSKVLKRDRKVFAAYKSMMAVETERIPSATLRLAAIACGLLLVMLAAWWFTINRFGGGFKHEAQASPSYGLSVHSEKFGPPTPSPAESSVVSLPASSSTVSSVASPDQNGYIRSGRVRVVAVAGGSDIARIVIERETPDGLFHETYDGDTFTRWCRCYPPGLRVNSFVNLWTRNGFEPVPLYVRARHPSAQQKQANAPAANPRTFAPPAVSR